MKDRIAGAQRMTRSISKREILPRKHPCNCSARKGWETSAVWYWIRSFVQRGKRNVLPHEIGLLAECAAVRNRMILWLLYGLGIRVSALINLRVGDIDLKKGVEKETS
jgi:integrase